MSDQMIRVWNQAAEAFQQRYEQIGDNWGASTPCDEWDVKALVEHAVGVQSRVAQALGASIDGDDWPAVKAAAEVALTQPGALDGMLDSEVFGQMPKPRLVGIATGDLLIHTWDLAQALGIDATLPEEAVIGVHGGLAMMPAEMMRGPGRFAAEVEVAADASPQDKLIAFAGRRP